MNARDDGLVIRPATADDLPAILDLLAAAMSRDTADPRFEALYRWKHEENAFGPSPAWVASDPAAGGRIAGVRVFMRWEFDAGGERRRAVRAVDTATHPEYQGRGIFTRLTLHALEAVREEGVDFVFNTPNDQSRPGYLKMGWEQVGRMPVACRPRSPLTLARMLAARVPARGGARSARSVSRRPTRSPTTTPSPPSSPRSRDRLCCTRLSARRSYVGVTAPHSSTTAPSSRKAGSPRASPSSGCDAGAQRARSWSPTCACRATIRAAGAHSCVRWRACTPATTCSASAARRSRPTGSSGSPARAPVLTRRTVTSDAPAGPAGWGLTLGDVELF
ncbi:MAG: GNAT family N-acetyltransferase [Acidimicrobiia bacterium]|nr:GNAT family N-acetyltransferase [Acidimicrobiia bacterium]